MTTQRSGPARHLRFQTDNSSVSIAPATCPNPFRPTSTAWPGMRRPATHRDTCPTTGYSGTGSTSKARRSGAGASRTGRTDARAYPGIPSCARGIRATPRFGCDEHRLGAAAHRLGAAVHRFDAPSQLRYATSHGLDEPPDLRFATAHPLDAPFHSGYATSHPIFARSHIGFARSRLGFAQAHLSFDPSHVGFATSHRGFARVHQ